MGAKAAFTRECVGLPPRGEQLALIDGAPAPVEKRDGPGRPPGSLNKDTEEMRRYLAALGYRPGQVALAEIGGGGDLDQLIARAKKISKELGCKPIEAFKLILDAAKEFSLYTGSKVQPDRGAGDAPGVVLLQVSEAQAREIGSGGVLIVGSLESQQNQELIDVTPGKSDTSQSDT